MSPAGEFTIGSEVACSDGPCGKLTRVVVDPIARAVTQLVVEPGHLHRTSRLVPVGLVESTGGEIKLSCSISEFEALEPAVETILLPAPDGEWGYEPQQMLSLPYYGLGAGPVGMGSMGDAGIGAIPVGPHLVTQDRVPLGDVEVRRGDPVEATDGSIGRVQGLVVDPADHHVTHVLLDEGHLWGRKRVAIPIAAVQDVAEGVRLSLSKDQVRDLPPVSLADD